MHPPQVSVLHLQQSVLFKNWSGWGTWPQVNTRGPPYPLSACKECPAKCTQASMQKQTNLDPNKGTLVKFDRQLRFDKERQKSRIFQVEQVHSGLLKTDGQDVLWIPPSPFFSSFCSAQLHVKMWKHLKAPKFGYLTWCVIKHLSIHRSTKQRKYFFFPSSSSFPYLFYPRWLSLLSPSCFSPFCLPPMAESGRATGSKTCEQQNVGQPSVLSYRLETAVFAGHSLCLLDLSAIAEPCRAKMSP